MAHTWTKEQTMALEDRNHTLLVSAAAGSGKTAVMTERIIRLLTDEENPADISRLLIVTYTRTAAAEIRTRISKALSQKLAEQPQNRHLTRQMMLLGGAHISTIDAFYLDLVKKHFEEVGFPPSFRLADETELLSLRRDVMNTAIDRMYGAHPDFYLVDDLLSDIKNESSLTERLLTFAEKLEGFPQGENILLHSAEETEKTASAPFENSFGEIYYQEAWRIATAGKKIAETFFLLVKEENDRSSLLKKYGASFEELREHCNKVLKALMRKDADGVAAAFEEKLTARISSARVKDILPATEHAVRLVEKFRKEWKEKAPLFEAFDLAEMKGAAEDSAHLLTLLYEVMHCFNQDYTAAKRLREVAEFSDISRAAYHLLCDEKGEPTPLARSVAALYDGIYIDECQDINSLQDATFRAISTPRDRFMVGDIKQCIFRFRGSAPSLFAHYRKSFPSYETLTEKDDAATVFMSKCFRCARPIIDFANTVSGYLFRHSDGFDYTEKDDLVFGKEENPSSPKCHITIVNRPTKQEKEEGAETDERNPELLWVVGEIENLLKSGKKADGTAVKPADIAVLARNKTHFAELSALLRARGIPFSSSEKSNFFENPEVLCIYSYLAVIDNPLRDIYMAALLRSPLFGFTLEDLIAIRNGAEQADSLYEALESAPARLADKNLAEKAERFIQTLTSYREKARDLPVDRLLRELYRDTAALSLSNKQDVAEGINENLLRLYEYARKFEAGGFKGLYQFVRYVEDIMSNETKMPAVKGSENAVSLLTVHAAKGLEYPICFLTDTASPFKFREKQQNWLLDEQLGAAVRLSNAGAFSHAETFSRTALSIKKEAELKEEEICILYVALTRAKERLYVTGYPRGDATHMEEEAELEGSRVFPYFATAGSSYLAWILAALAGKDCSSYCELEVIPATKLWEKKEKKARTTASATPVETAKSDEIKALFKERFSFEYPYLHLSKLPAKLSVSRLTPAVLDVYDTDASPFPTKISQEEKEDLLRTFEEEPCFDRKSTPDAAERGTATHEFLQFCNFEAAKANGVEEELSRLIAEGFLSEDVRKAVRLPELKQFFESDFYALLSTAKEVHREARFNIFLPAEKFTANEEFRHLLSGEKLLVQGVIDLFFRDRDGNLILCDYKTDRLPKEALHSKEKAAAFLFARHGEQLRYYGEALYNICGQYPDRVLIYSLPLGEAVEAP